MKKPSGSVRPLVTSRSAWKIQIDGSPFWYQIGPLADTTLGIVIAEFCAKMGFDQAQVTDVKKVEPVPATKVA